MTAAETPDPNLDDSTEVDRSTVDDETVKLPKPTALKTLSRTKPLSTRRLSPSRLSRTKRRILAGPFLVMAFGVMAFSVVAFTGATAHGATTTVSTSPADIAAGHALFIAHCQSCHGVNGTGSSRAPELIDAGAAAADFYLSTGRMPLNNPGDEALRHRPFFNGDQIRQLVAYVNALPDINHSDVSGPTIPTVLPACSATVTQNCTTLTEGQRLFSVNCAQCHDSSGAGGIISKGNIVPSLRNADLVQVVEAMRVGPKPMPVFGAAFSDVQVSAIANYVQTLHNANGRGGLGIAHFGPVPEGFIGIIVGLGLLLIASRLIGTRR